MSAFPPKLPWAELYVRSGLKSLSDRVRQRPMVRRVRGAVDDLRTTVGNVARQRLPEAAAIAERMVRRAFDSGIVGPSPIINATGVISLRSLSMPLADPAIVAMNAVAEECATTSSALESLLVKLTGAEAAMALHSPAAAAMAVVSALGGPIIVARSHVGELGATSLPDLVTLAGARLVEVGSVGQVTRDDFRAAFAKEVSGCLWYAQPQSIAIEGVVTATPAEEIFAVARDHRCPVIEYLEEAALGELAFGGGTTVIPIVGTSLLAGADLVIFPGDRYIGGPSCGLVVGKSALVSRVAAHPLSRASAIDHLRLAALITTLQITTDRDKAASIPTHQLLTTTAENLRHRAERLSTQLAGSPGIAATEAVPCPGYLDEGRLPSRQITGWGVAISLVALSPETIVQKLLDSPIRVAAAMEDGRVIINLRSVLAREDERIVAAIRALT